MTVRFMDEDSATGLLPCVRRAMFSEPLLAHPAEIGGVHPTWQPHPGDDGDRDPDHDDPDDEQHMVLAANRPPRRCNDPDTRQDDCLCDCAHGAGDHTGPLNECHSGAGTDSSGRWFDRGPAYHGSREGLMEAILLTASAGLHASAIRRPLPLRRSQRPNRIDRRGPAGGDQAGCERENGQYQRATRE